MPGFDPWVRKIPWRRKRQPTPVFMPGKSHGPRSLVGYTPWGRKESDTTERLLCVCVCACVLYSPLAIKFEVPIKTMTLNNDLEEFTIPFIKMVLCNPLNNCMRQTLYRLSYQGSPSKTQKTSSKFQKDVN